MRSVGGFLNRLPIVEPFTLMKADDRLRVGNWILFGRFRTKIMSKRIDLFLGFLVAVLWGGNFAVIELGLRDLDPFVLTFLRFAFCAFPLVFFIERPRNVSLINIALYGVIFGVGLWWVVNFAMHSGLSAGLSSVFLQFSAFFTILLSLSLIHI